MFDAFHEQPERLEQHGQHEYNACQACISENERALTCAAISVHTRCSALEAPGLICSAGEALNGYVCCGTLHKQWLEYVFGDFDDRFIRIAAC